MRVHVLAAVALAAAASVTAADRVSPVDYVNPIIGATTYDELAAAPRSGMIRFTYSEADTARIQIDLARRIGGSSTMQRVEVVPLGHKITDQFRC